MDLGISGRRAAVAASSAGLGLAAARALAAEGVDVAVCGRDGTRLSAAVESVSDVASGRVVGLAADVSDPEGAAGFVEAAIAELGGVDILVANAGGPPPGTFATTTIDAYQDALNLNLLSTVAMCRTAVPHMQEQGWGRVLAITSIGARQPIPRLMASTTARAGVTAFLKVLATEVAPDGVTVNSLQPGLHRTDRLASLNIDDLDALTSGIPAGTIGDAGDFGSILTFLAGNATGFLTGAAIPVDGGAAQALQ